MLVVAAGCLAVLAVVILLARRHRIPFLPAKTIGESERKQVAGRLRQAIERAGGDNVWVKSPPYAPFPPAKAETAAEGLVAQPKYEAVRSAFERQAADEGLQVRSKVSSGQEQLRLADLRLERDRALAGRWLLREVPRIRHAAIIIDDLGLDLTAVRQLLGMPFLITFAVLPHLAHSKVIAEEAHRAGREVMLHLPMEPDSPAKPGPGEVRIGMGEAEVERLVDEDLGSVPFAAGINNHMGSRATTNAKLMGEVVEALARRRLFFIDSRTTPQSIALEVARRRGIPTFYRSVFLDDVEAVPYTLGQLRTFIGIVEDQSAAIAIGHPYPTTLTALVQFLPELERHGIRLMSASQLLRLPETAHLAPASSPAP